MVSGFNSRSIIQGALLLAVGYAASALAATGAASSGSRVLIAVAGLLFLIAPVAAGFRSGFIAQTRRITHGVLAGLVGTTLVLLGLTLLVRAPLAPSHFAALAATLLLGSWLGSLLAVGVVSRRGR